MWTGGDDQFKAGPVGAVVAHRVLERIRELALRAPHKPLFEHPSQARVCRFRGAADRIDLTRAP